MTRALRDRLALKVGQHYKEARYKKLWQVRLAAQMVELPEFDTVYRGVRRSFRQAGFFGK